MSRVNSFNYSYPTIFKFADKFDTPFLHVFIFENLFTESHCFVAMPVTSCITDTCSNLSIYI